MMDVFPVCLFITPHLSINPLDRLAFSCPLQTLADCRFLRGFTRLTSAPRPLTKQFRTMIWRGIDVSDDSLMRGHITARSVVFMFVCGYNCLFTMASITDGKGATARAASGSHWGQQRRVAHWKLQRPSRLLLFGCFAIVAVVVSRSPAASYQKLTTTTTTAGKLRELQFSGIGNSGIGSSGLGSGGLSSAISNGGVSNSFDFDFLPTFTPLTAALESIFPFFRPRQYSLQSIDSFLLYFVCTDIAREGCSAANTIQFTNVENPPPNGFRYLDSGPEQLQGVFWTRQNILSQALATFAEMFDTIRSELVSFAPTRHGDGVETGILQTDQNGYEFVFRVLGDHSWSASENAPDTFASAADILYLFDLVEGTLENPLRFVITPSFKLWYNCLRFNFGELTQCTLVGVRSLRVMLTITNTMAFSTRCPDSHSSFCNAPFAVVSKFEQILITDPNNEYVRQYPGSQLWLRRNRLLNLVTLDYLIIQVVDGNGNKIEPAWSEFSESAPVIQYTGLLPNRLDDRLQC